MLLVLLSLNCINVPIVMLGNYAFCFRDEGCLHGIFMTNLFVLKSSSCQSISFHF